MKKIVVIGPNAGMGGVERASVNIANGFVEFGNEVTYIALIPKSPFFELKSKYIEPNGFNNGSMDLIKTLRYIRKHVIDIKPDAILCFTKFYAAIANMALIFSRYKIYVTERSSPLYKWPEKIEWFCRLSFSLKKVNGVISQTSIASEFHKKYYGNTKYTIIPNAIREIKLYPYVKREKIILAVGRFQDTCKGFDLLVKAFNGVSNDEWRLVFAGGTREEGKYLLDFANENKKSMIDFIGPVKDIDLLYARAGIFVMPSRSEGYPNALAEALIAGCCCISFDFTAGARDLIKDGFNGVLIEPENYVKLGEVLSELIVNKNKRELYSSNARLIKNNLDYSKIIQSYLKFIL
ncbi:glycosyltransferase [Schleiferia thermophila]|jgi:glycosyltransferase involved in cell wall biosynthesis|uniref:glycosyltransferase n=1 Tax=Schleiferia thermophila TaxID=884107 RepID=UPI002FD9C533